MIGQKVGSYQVVKRLGVGGMGAVYLAVHPIMGRQAAVKMLLPQYSGERDLVERFFQEAKATALVGHPGIVEIFDFGTTEDGRAYLVMEHLLGESLAIRLQRDKRLPWQVAAQLARQVASAVGAAHDKGVVHRDLKPDNLFLVPDRDQPGGLRVKVLDFGIAKLARASQASRALTSTGMALGTPKYMAPEQCLDAASVDGRADIYALGCILFEMVCGRPPFTADSHTALLAKQLKSPPPRPRDLEPGLPAAFEEIILGCLEKQASARPQHMQLVADALDAGLARRQSSDDVAPTSPVERDADTTGGRVIDHLISDLPADADATPSPPPPRDLLTPGNLPLLSMSSIGNAPSPDELAAHDEVAAPSTLSEMASSSSRRRESGVSKRGLIAVGLGGSVFVLGLVTWLVARAGNDLRVPPPTPGKRTTATSGMSVATLPTIVAAPDAARPDAARPPDASPPDAIAVVAEAPPPAPEAGTEAALLPVDAALVPVELPPFEPGADQPLRRPPRAIPTDETPARSRPVKRATRTPTRPTATKPAAAKPTKPAAKPTRPKGEAGRPLEDGAIDPFAE